ncbi:MAG: Flp pilus assembly protein CpaB [Pseudomonadota bacterium]
MRLGFIMILIAGLGIAGFSGYLVMQEFERLNGQIASLRTEAAKVVPTKSVYVANADINYGHILTREDVKKFDWPTALLPENGYYETEEDLFGTAEDPQEPIVLQAMNQNDLVARVKVTQPGEDAGLVSRVGAGLRAFSISVDVTSGTFLRPGDSVDIFWIGRVENRQSATRLLLEGVQLIAINSDLEATARSTSTQGARTITIAIPPQTVATLVQAQNSGKLVVSLRGLGDTGAVGDLTVTRSDFLGIEEQEEEVIVEEQKCFTTVRRGTEIVRTEIPCSN